MLVSADQAALLHFGVDALVDLRAGAIVGRDDQCALRRFRYRPDAVLAARNLMDAALSLQVLYGLAYLSTRKLLDHLFQLRVFLAHDLVQLHRFHAGVLELRERTPGLDRLMLPPIANQEHAIVGMQTIHKLVHLFGGRKRGFVEDIHPDTSDRRLYILDESSLASTKQMHAFVSRLRVNDRVLLVGDTRQHESVEAGRPFAQLQENGMKTVRLDEIVRQRDPALTQVVGQLAQGEVAAAVAGLERQGRVIEMPLRADRIAAIAHEYVKAPGSTLVISPDNRSRTEINERIRKELQAHGAVSRQEHQVITLVSRQDLTGADRSWAQKYQVNDVLRYSRTSDETGMKKGEYTRVTSIDTRSNLLTVLRVDGSERTYDPRRHSGVSVYRDEQRAFSVGDRVQFTAPNQDLKIANRELGTIKSIDESGRMAIRLESGRDLRIDPQRHPHLDHGYAVTSYSGQGQTADRVLIHADTDLPAKDLLNNRMAYVAVSRGASDAQIFTNDRSRLAEALSRDVSHESAQKPEKTISPIQQDVAQSPQLPRTRGMEIGMVT